MRYLHHPRHALLHAGDATLPHAHTRTRGLLHTPPRLAKPARVAPTCTRSHGAAAAPTFAWRMRCALSGLVVRRTFCWPFRLFSLVLPAAAAANTSYQLPQRTRVPLRRLRYRTPYLPSPSRLCNMPLPAAFCTFYARRQYLHHHTPLPHPHSFPSGSWFRF